MEKKMCINNNKHNNCLEHYFFLKLKNSQLHGTKTNNKFYYVL